MLPKKPLNKNIWKKNKWRHLMKKIKMNKIDLIQCGMDGEINYKKQEKLNHM
jgi:hypothetical protein